MQIIVVGQCYISVLNNLPEFISIYIRVFYIPIDNINSFIDLMRIKYFNYS